MKSQPNHRGVPLGLAAGLLAIAFVVGCDKNKASNTSGPGPMQGSGAPGAGSSGPPVPPEFAAGRAVFDTNCAKCHSIGGGGGAMAGGPPGGFGGGPPGGLGGGPPGGPGGGMMMKKGPDLVKIGADEKHTKEWLTAYISDPKTQNPRSGMPAFAGKIAEADFGKLVDYLVSLK